MRKWKIRNKMIAGLSCLAFAIGVLVYSGWSQLARDRHLATEISQLADEIHFASELNRWAERLSRSHLQYLDQISAQHRMIESNNLINFEEAEQHSKVDEAFGDIELAFIRFRGLLDDYRDIVSQHASAKDATTLLVNRVSQAESLIAIDGEIKLAQEIWDKAKRDRDDAMLSKYHRENLKRQLDHLLGLSQKHFDEIYNGMKMFRDNVHQEQLAKRKQFWFFTSISAFLILFLAWQFWALIVVPFRTLIRGSQLIASGHMQHQIELGTNDEIGAMAKTVNDITLRFNTAVENEKEAKQRAEQEVRDRTREVIQNEQLASVGFLAAGVAHEINNPLGAIAWGAEALEESLDDLPEDAKELYNAAFLSELRTNLGLIQSEAFRCKGITKRLLHFSRLSDSTREQEDLGELVSRVVSMVGKVGEYRCKTIQTHCNDRVKAYCNAQEIQQVVLNLVSNALESVGTDGKVDVSVRNELDSLSGNRQAVVVVQDDGCGMTQEVMEHLFEPFFTRRQDNTGTGLGLSISYRIVSLHHGSLTPHSDGEGRGSQMVLRLPASRPAQEPVAAIDLPEVTNQLNSSDRWKHVEKVA